MEISLDIDHFVINIGSCSAEDSQERLGQVRPNATDRNNLPKIRLLQYLYFELLHIMPGDTVLYSHANWV